MTTTYGVRSGFSPLHLVGVRSGRYSQTKMLHPRKGSCFLMENKAMVALLSKFPEEVLVS